MIGNPVTVGIRREQAEAKGSLDAAAIRRAGPIPYYAQLAQILREQIAGARWKPGSAIPAESELCSIYGLSRTVVRQALNELVAEGLVQKEKGRGTFVSRPKIADFTVHELRGFLDEMSARGHAVETTVLRQAIVAVPPDVAPELGSGPRGKVVVLSRVRSVNGDPIVKCDSYLPVPRFARLVDVDLRARGLYDVLASDFGVQPRGGHRRIEATLASRELADALAIDVGAPLLTVTAVSVDQNGVPFECFRASYRGDRTSFDVRVGPSGS